MFEKEAEKHCNEILCSVCEKVTCAFEGIKCREWRDRRAGFYCGAEFGYNKANEELEEKYKETLCNSEMNLNSVTEQLEELEKANEWHYVKDGDLPKDFGYYLVALKSVAYKGFVFEVAYFTGNIFTKGGEISDNVYAWKEIVLPKESE